MNLKIEELKNELEAVIKDTNTCMDKVYQISSDIDEEIIKEYFNKNSNIVLDEYDKYFDRSDKRQLLRQIKSDILENFDKISLKELEILSSNFYDYCCLMYNQIPTNEIAQYFLHKNSYYYENLTEENKKKIFPTDDDKLASLIILSNKYTDKLKNSRKKREVIYMKILRLTDKQEINFIDYFIQKEHDFLTSINIEAYNNKDFKFYISWFIYSIDEYMKEQYDIEENFSDNFTNNKSLNIIFLTFIMSENFRNKVIEDIIEYKHIYNKDSILV